MKFLTLLCFCLSASFASSLTAQEAPSRNQNTHGIDWHTDIEHAKHLAREKGQPIFLYFSGSDWCPHCKKMDREILAAPAFVEMLANKVIFVHIDSPRRTKLDRKTEEQNHRLKKEFDIKGFPTVIMVDANLHKLGSPMRKSNPQDYAKEVQKFLH